MSGNVENAKIITHLLHKQEAYQQWVCSAMVPHWIGGHRLKPCRSVCHKVEQKCPFFLPGDRAPAYPTQYAGEPTFLCLDPNIPETGDQLQRSVHGPPDCCYTPCQGSNCPTEVSLCRDGPTPAPSPPPPENCESYLPSNPCALPSRATPVVRVHSRLSLLIVLLHIGHWRWHLLTIRTRTIWK